MVFIRIFKSFNMKKYILLTCLLIFFLSGNLFLTKAQNNDPTSYPYAQTQKGQIDKWGFYTRNCTSYSAYKADLIVKNFHNSMKGPNGKTGKYGNAHSWNENAGAIGFKVSSNPVANSIVVWESNKGGSGPYGHVAYVESVNQNGTFNISEYNWNYGDGNYNTRNGLKNDTNTSFIIFGSDLSFDCKPPSTNDWIVKNDCEIKQNYKVSGNVSIINGSKLVVKDGASLDINFEEKKVEIDPSSKLVLENNSKVF